MRFVLSLLLLLCASRVCAQVRVAVWDPQKGTREHRFRIDIEQHEQAAAWLRSAGMDVQRITASQMADSGVFKADRFDVLVLAGEAIPRDAFATFKRFADDGGVVVAMEAAVPFLIGIAPEPDGMWTMSPKAPAFAWQTDELLGHFGLMYEHSQARHNTGFDHTITPLLRPYLGQATDLANHQLSSRWIVPHKDPAVRGRVYPLVRSARIDGKDAPPQVFIAERQGRRAIISISGTFTAGRNPKLWPWSQQTMVALVRLAGDLRSGNVQLRPEHAIALPHDMEAPAPLARRRAAGHVEPDGAKPIVRWGQFDGSCMDLPEKASDGAPLPQAIQPGAQVRLPIPAITGNQAQLRIRLAYTATGGVLRLAMGESRIWDEQLNYLDAGGRGNFQAPSLEDVAAEITRVVYVCRSDAREVILSNPGTQPFWIDAMQLETSGEAKPWLIGLNASQATSVSGAKSPIPPEISRRWDRLRANVRTQYVGEPGKADRWKRCDQILGAQLAMSDRLDVILEGTPPWAGITPERMKDGQAAGRPHVVPPDPRKYAQIVEELVARYGDRIDAYEIWNEPNIVQFWRGTTQEYIDLFKAIVPVIRRSDPAAKVVLAGMAGVNEDFVQQLAASGVFAEADLVSIHPYAGKSPAWDMVYGQLEGALMALGINKEIYCNESGFVWKNSGWFTAPPVYDERMQEQMLAMAMARLTASGASRIIVFHCGGDNHDYGLFNEKGEPRPAYAVMEDYMRLSDREGRRAPLSMVRADGEPLKGIHAAVARHKDGSFTVVINPAENLDLQPVRLRTPSWSFDDINGWVFFSGKAKAEAGRAELTVAEGKSYIGFYVPARMDPALMPRMRIRIAEAQKPVNFSMTIAGKEQVLLANIGPGEHDLDLTKLMPPEVQDVQITFRCQGRTLIDAVQILRADGSPAPAEFTLPPKVPAIDVRIRLPLVSGARYTAQATGGRMVAEGESLRVSLTGRAIIQLAPAR